MNRSAQVLATLLKEKELTIAFAESMTCGLAAHCLGGVSHTSDFFKGSVICYDEEVKTSLLKVKPALIEKHTAESAQVTDALAKNLQHLIKADVYAAVTGLAAHGGSESKSKPVGTVFYTVYFKRKLFREKKKFSGTPLHIKKKACKEFYRFITTVIKAQ